MNDWNGYGSPNFPAQAQPYGNYGGGPSPADPNAGARTMMPTMRDMGGRAPGVPPFVRVPWYPTSPFYSTDPGIGVQGRYYTAQLLASDNDFAVGTEVLRRVQFDLPVQLIAQNGAAQITNSAALPVGYDSRNLFRYRLEYTQGDRLVVSSTLGSNVLGSAERPGELGGPGWTFNMGATVIIGITPLIAALNVDIVLLCAEMRAPSNFVPPGAR